MLVIVERFPPDIGGLAQSGARTAEALARVGATVDVLAFTRLLPPGALETTRHVGARGEEVALHRFGLFSNLDASLQHTLNLVEWLHGERAFHLVWGHYVYPAGFVAVLVAQLLGVRATVSARGNDVDRMMFPPGDFARLTWTLERADVITAVSRELARKIDVLLGRDGQVEPIPNAVDLGLFRGGHADGSLREGLGILPGEAVLGFCGELRHKKGFPFMLEALCQVRAVRPACLLVIGEVRPKELPHLQAFAADHPEDAKRILVTERIDDRAAVAEHYRCCDLFLQPSVWDGLPNALLEAMACERVALVSDAGGMAEVIEHGHSGLVLPKSQLHRLGPAVLEALELPVAQRAAIGQAARARVAAAYAPEHEEAALRQVLARALR